MLLRLDTIVALLLASIAGWLERHAAARIEYLRYQYLMHDRDSIFAAHLDESVSRLGVEVSRSPQRSPKANTICERVIGTLRRECLDWVILWGANSSTVARGLTYEHSALKVVPARSTSTMRVFASSCSPASIKRLASRSMTTDYIGQHCVRNLRVSH